MPTNRTAAGKWKAQRRAMITKAKRAGTLQCALCGRQLDPDAPRCTDAAIELDHVVPVAAGGTDEQDNLQLSCYPCNRAKGDGTRAATTVMPRVASCRVHGTSTRTSCPHSGALVHLDDPLPWLAERWEHHPWDYTGDGPQYLRDTEQRGLVDLMTAAAAHTPGE